MAAGLLLDWCSHSTSGFRTGHSLPSGQRAPGTVVGRSQLSDESTEVVAPGGRSLEFAARFEGRICDNHLRAELVAIIWEPKLRRSRGRAAGRAGRPLTRAAQNKSRGPRRAGRRVRAD